MDTDAHASVMILAKNPLVVDRVSGIVIAYVDFVHKAVYFYMFNPSAEMLHEPLAQVGMRPEISSNVTVEIEVVKQKERYRADV
ncbi:hypothetical protein Alches_16210 [Alicyclobacillus hesperidum subsp. aegles]|uniref:hypothetical protein n=1 Tax=Alicyclobacillus hesperidum TaxID=89784 RepID=UPI00222DED04|nr:hypothetical protein [Alicyclobacillus hesperidum]GLG01581.1 hypothetical protein Alches_16210 [Alicyclobacillus hesperidum subsp. aegles]